MAAVTRLLTTVDLPDANDGGPDARTMSVSALLEAVLDDGRRIVLLDDRGWSSQIVLSWDREPSEEELRATEFPGAWAYETVENMEQQARMVVGPDEPFGDETQAEADAGHWNTLARTLQRQGVSIEGAELRTLPHDVELSDRVRARLGHGRTD